MTESFEQDYDFDVSTNDPNLAPDQCRFRVCFRIRFVKWNFARPVLEMSMRKELFAEFNKLAQFIYKVTAESSVVQPKVEISSPRSNLEVCTGQKPGAMPLFSADSARNFLKHNGILWSFLYFLMFLVAVWFCITSVLWPTRWRDEEIFGLRSEIRNLASDLREVKELLHDISKRINRNS